MWPNPQETDNKKTENNFFTISGNTANNESQGTTVKNTVISPNFLVWKFCGKPQFSHKFEWYARNYAETAPFHKKIRKLG